MMEIDDDVLAESALASAQAYWCVQYRLLVLLMLR